MAASDNQHIFTQQQQERFFEHSLCGFVIVDPKGLIVKSNQRFTLWTGYATDELQGKKFAELLGIGARMYYETHLSPMLRMQGFFDEVLLDIKKADGQKFRTLVNALEILSDDHVLQYVQYIIFKASDRLQFEQNLQLAKESAEGELLAQKEIVALREQLIAVLGHDLRNPLAAIHTGIALLGYGKLDEQQQNVLQILKRSSARMNELVDNIMDFARTRLGAGIVLNKKETDLSPIIHQVIRELQLTNDQCNIIADVNISAAVYCDGNRIGQLLSNLIANALTHGTQGMPIYVTAVSANHVLEIKVTNVGHPIPENLREKLFAPFTREEGRVSQNGLGLGLYICAEIARSHNASLSFTSTEAETSFIFSMQLENVGPH